MSTKEKSKSERHRAWCFTWNNYTDEDCRYLEEEVGEIAEYIVCGHEKAPTTGTPHLQGFVYFANARTFSGVQKLLLKSAHIEPAKSIPHAVQYCKKDGHFFLKGRSLNKVFDQIFYPLKQLSTQVLRNLISGKRISHYQLGTTVHSIDTDQLYSLGEPQPRMWYGFMDQPALERHTTASPDIHCQTSTSNPISRTGSDIVMSQSS